MPKVPGRYLSLQAARGVLEVHAAAGCARRFAFMQSVLQAVTICIGISRGSLHIVLYGDGSGQLCIITALATQLLAFQSTA